MIQLSLVPDYVRVLVCFGVVEPRNGSRLSADDACEAGAETVLARLERMADPTGVAKQSIAVLFGAYPAPKQISARVRDSALAAAECDKKIGSSCLPTGLPHHNLLAVKDVLSRIRD